MVGSIEGAIDESANKISLARTRCFTSLPPPFPLLPGTFWHLATRPDEFNDIPRDWADLKAVAHTIADRLNALAAGPHG